MVHRSEQVRRVLELAGDEAARLGHGYVGPEHLLLALLREGGGAARVMRARGVDLGVARAALGRLAESGVVPHPRPSDAELLGTLGIDLDAIRRTTEQAFSPQALEHAIREAIRRRRGGIGRVPRTPLRGPPLLAVQALALAHQEAEALGYDEVGTELLLLGVVKDIQTRWPRCMRNRWQRRLWASVGLPEGYRGAAGPLLEALGVQPDELREALMAELRETVP